MIKKFIAADEHVTLWGDGTPIREFLFVDDAAEAIVRALELPHDLEPINVGTGSGISIRDLASLIAGIVGFEGDIVWDTTRPNGAQFKVLNVSRLASTLHWTPRYSLEEGLRLTIDWYRANKAAADMCG
jgi:GDP-L-fucose synthase